MENFNLSDLDVTTYNENFGFVYACLSEPINVKKLEELSLNGYDLFKENTYLGVPFLSLFEMLDEEKIYTVLDIFSKKSNMLKDYKVEDENLIVYELAKIRCSKYYLKILKLFLEKGLNESLKEEIINRINYEFLDMYKDIFYIDFMEYCKYTYYSYMLVTAYLDNKHVAHKIRKYKKDLDFTLFKNWDWYYLKIYLSEDKKRLYKVEAYDKKSDTLLLILS